MAAIPFDPWMLHGVLADDVNGDTAVVVYW
jgi:hypothetical protein